MALYLVCGHICDDIKNGFVYGSKVITLKYANKVFAYIFNRCTLRFYPLLTESRVKNVLGFLSNSTIRENLITSDLVILSKHKKVSISNNKRSILQTMIQETHLSGVFY